MIAGSLYFSALASSGHTMGRKRTPKAPPHGRNGPRLAPQPLGRSTMLRFGIPATLFVLTIAVYLRTTTFDFVSYDDDQFVFENPYVSTGLTLRNVAWAFDIHGPSQYHPLAWLSHMLDVELFGLRPAGHHAVNVFVHALSVVLLYLAMTRMTGTTWRSAAVAVVFALHPAHVESVAWVSERKDVLCALFVFVTMLAYARYAEQPSGRRYAAVFVAYAMALMSKPMAVTLPALLLLLDYWPLRRAAPHGAADPAGGGVPPRRLIVEKLPLLAMAALSAGLSLLCQLAAGVVSSLENVSLASRATNVFVSYVRYLRMSVLPVKLSAFYPYVSDWPVWVWGGSVLLMVAITFACVRSRRPYAVVGWLWFVISLIPVIGLLQVGAQSIADRYTYLPYVGLSILAAWGLAEVAMRSSTTRRTVVSASAVLLVAACIITFIQIGHWRNSETLFRQAIRATKDNDVAHYNLGASYDDQGDLPRAMDHYLAALSIRPNHGEAHQNLGIDLHLTGQPEKAEVHLREAVRLRPDSAEARFNFANFLADRGRLDEAAGEMEQGLKLNPNNVTARLQYAAVLFRRGEQAAALDQAERVLQLAPDNPEAKAAVQQLRASPGR
jgi:Flp pilus assembly protein TadD